NVEEAKQGSKKLGEEIFPSNDAWGSIRQAASMPRTWMLVALYFTSLGGFLALTVWYPTYWVSFHGVDGRTAGIITALGFALLATFIRIPGGFLSDRVGGERLSAVSFATVGGAGILMTIADGFGAAVAAMLCLAVGIGVANAAVTQLVPLYVPEAVGGASGIIGGIGAFGGFVIPPILRLFVDYYGVSGYATGFTVISALGVFGVILSIVIYTKFSQRAVGS
ncbi:MFS transporter, partial [Halorubrum sp. AD140]|uniref:MFS transporter n=1 Tax=Halorubrum sp. AD140 TaxID=3050073 RepID=UPI002ACCBEED